MSSNKWLYPLRLISKELIELLIDELDCSKRTIIIRLKQIIENATVIVQNEVNHTLCTCAESKEVIYYLNPLKSSSSTKT